jgi:hypothetical protein
MATAKNTAPAEIPAGAPLDWNEPTQAEPTVVEKAEAKVEDLLNLPVARDAYVLGLETELVFYGEDKARKAAITAELDRVRGGKAVAPKKETR